MGEIFFPRISGILEWVGGWWAGCSCNVYVVCMSGDASGCELNASCGMETTRLLQPFITLRSFLLGRAQVGQLSGYRR